ncbi:MAG: VOC family protein [Sandarakinorhabdus sp.]|nr:VOC family protein [Sandarakinorhabdus sp.]
MGITALGYVVVSATDLSAWQAFACDVLGMMPGDARPDGALALRLDDRPFRILIEPGVSDRFGCIGLECAGEGVWTGLVARVEAAGIAVTHSDAATAKARRVASLVRFDDPAGNAIELYHGRVTDYAPFTSPAGVSGFVTGNMGLGHAVLPAPALEPCVDFYKSVLGFGDTDRISVPVSPDPDGPSITVRFLHCDNPRHHSVALADMPQPAGAVHIMVEACTTADVGRAYYRAKAAGAHISSTLGEHANDRMFSFYVRSPGGFDIEFGCGGWQVDWATYVPTISTIDSLWGHEWNFG